MIEWVLINTYVDCIWSCYQYLIKMLQHNFGGFFSHYTQNIESHRLKSVFQSPCGVFNFTSSVLEHHRSICQACRQPCRPPPSGSCFFSQRMQVLVHSVASAWLIPTAGDFHGIY